MGMVLVNPAEVRSFFESLQDPRSERNRRHALIDVIVIGVLASVVGCTGPTAMARWAHAKAEMLAQFLELKNGIPSRDCIRRVFSILNPLGFQQSFTQWLASLLRDADAEADDADADDADAGPGNIAIDGKTNRRSHDRDEGLGPLHLVSAWATKHGVALGQVATEAKSNEITAIPELLKQIDVKGAVVTIDAMGCQKEIVEQIVAQGGDYTIAVKANQPKLCEAIQDAITVSLDDLTAAHQEYQTADQTHGRDEQRYYHVISLPEDFPEELRKEWPSVKTLGCAIRITTHSDGTTSDEVRYYINSHDCTGQHFAEAVRGHWSIENSLHWVLDMNFREDENRTRERTLGNNLSWLRRFAISLLRRHPSKDSIRGKMQQASWNDVFLLEVITGK